MSVDGTRPLLGRRVLVTRATEQSVELTGLLEAAGARVAHLPAISFEPPPDWESLDRVIEAPDDWDWVVFTSSNGVAWFAERAGELGRKPSLAIHASVAAVGSATADALREIGIQPTVVPPRFRGPEIASVLPDDQRGVRTAVVRALEGRDELIEELRARGGEVHVAVAYRTRGLEHLPDEVRRSLVEGSIDAMTFTSPSTVTNVLRHLSPDELRRILAHAAVVSIGPTTSATLRELGIDAVHEAVESTVRGLVDAVIRALAPAPGTRARI